ncbi:hypothetical protein SISNIDRAFT_469373 [Sistotremastrum niveocremeum HHB9708]|uniref:DUF7598 domain-containing protein n=1 Tax=Sistotremastrum niveocremeum HHB9708 TaxID=1314777 RepID=A0A164Q521_9AGAM|nr:hypothetical protein SISNIDRAFT_469373 [Sistotremastrum niveocremeum HHB9708]
MMPLRGYIFIGLNAIRALSIIALLLVFASNILVIVHDIQAVNAFMANPPSTEDTWSTNSTSLDMNCDYIDGSTVPNQPAGVFWAVVNRLFILFECIVLLLAEVEWPMKFFDTYFPVLGSGFGLGALGIFQCLIGAAVLSHHIGTFALVSAFFLFSVGCLNCFTGLLFRAGGKEKRSITSWRVARENPLLPGPTGSLRSLRPMVMTGATPVSGSWVAPADSSAGSTFSEKVPPYGEQAASAFGRAASAGTYYLSKSMFSLSKPEEAHGNPTPKVTFSTSSRDTPQFSSSATAV